MKCYEPKNYYQTPQTPDQKREITNRNHKGTDLFISRNLQGRDLNHQNEPQMDIPKPLSLVKTTNGQTKFIVIGRNHK